MEYFKISDCTCTKNLTTYRGRLVALKQIMVSRLVWGYICGIIRIISSWPDVSHSQSKIVRIFHFYYDWRVRYCMTIIEFKSNVKVKTVWIRNLKTIKTWVAPSILSLNVCLMREVMCNRSRIECKDCNKLPEDTDERLDSASGGSHSWLLESLDYL